jgi:hypothetical protein
MQRNRGYAPPLKLTTSDKCFLASAFIEVEDVEPTMSSLELKLLLREREETRARVNALFGELADVKRDRYGWQRLFWWLAAGVAAATVMGMFSRI